MTRTHAIHTHVHTLTGYAYIAFVSVSVCVRECVKCVYVCVMCHVSVCV